MGVITARDVENSPLLFTISHTDCLFTITPDGTIMVDASVTQLDYEKQNLYEVNVTVAELDSFM